MAQWKFKVQLADIWRDESGPWVNRRDKIVERFRQSTWVKSLDEFDDMHGLLEELAETPNVDEFDQVLAHIYDAADVDRAWLATF